MPYPEKDREKRPRHDHRNPQPELERLIQQRMESGAFQSIEDVLMHALTVATAVESSDKSAANTVPSIAHLQKTDPEEWGRQFHAWAESHDRTTPLLSDGSYKPR